MAAADVTICIPAWQAEPFIERTLTCARGQTHERLHILVSVDRCDDGTVELCRAQAQADPRLEVVAQAERLGWSRNANFLLDRVDTELFFLYFHDDIIEPTYVEKLRAMLQAHPEAKSVHCDLQGFGKRQAIDLGNDYRGSPADRLIHFMVGPIKGTPLRSLTRSEVLRQGLRFPLIAGDGFWRCHPFLLTLLAAGPALRYPEVLYKRWFRDGSMTASWAPQRSEDLLLGQRESARLCLEIIDRLEASGEQKALVRFCLYVFILGWTRQHEAGFASLIEPLAISPAFAYDGLPAGLHTLEPKVQGWVQEAYAGMQALTRQRTITS